MFHYPLAPYSKIDEEKFIDLQLKVDHCFLMIAGPLM